MRGVQLLQRARHADGPALVAEVALDLADHVGRGVGGERHLAVQLEAVDRLDQADRAHLLDVLQRLAAAGVAAGQRAHERQVALDQLARGRSSRRPRGSGAAARGPPRGPRAEAWRGARSAHARPSTLLQPDDDAAGVGLLHAVGVDHRLEDPPERELRPAARRRRCERLGERRARAAVPTRARMPSPTTLERSSTLPSGPASASRRSMASWRSSISSKPKSHALGDAADDQSHHRPGSRRRAAPRARSGLQSSASLRDGSPAHHPVAAHAGRPSGPAPPPSAGALELAARCRRPRSRHAHGTARAW